MFMLIYKYHCNVHNLKKKLIDKFNNLAVGIIVFQVYFKAISNLVFYSILDILLLNNFLKIEKQVFVS